MIRELRKQSKPDRNKKSISGFRSVFKAISIFGGVQFFNIFISIVRGKLLAVLIGTAGMGLNGLLLSSLNLIQKASGLGLSESAVRDISNANSSGNDARIRRVYTIFTRWIWLSATIGVLLTITLSSQLSRIAFNDGSYTIAFIFLSLTFIFGALTDGIYTLLRGTRRIKDLAKANIAGSLAGLIITIPILYFYGINGVVASIIASSAGVFLVSLYFKHKMKIKQISITFSETFKEGKSMASLGITLTVSSLLGAGVKFLINAYISKSGSLDELGIYNAGHSIMAGYVGMIFTAMGTDYYPRLSGEIERSDRWPHVVNQQAEIILLILGPILTFILLTSPLLIKILLSAEFLPTIDFIIWASLAVLLKGIAWVSSFIFIAKGDNKVFLYTELVSQFLFLALSIVLFERYGISGLGIAMVVTYIFSVAMLVIILKWRYNFIFSKEAFILVGAFFIVITFTVLSIKAFSYPNAYYTAGLAFTASILIALVGLNRRLNMIEILKSFLISKR